MADPRQKVGGEVWAKAAAISRDFKRILGNQFEKTWIRGTVLRIEKRKASDVAKRATTYVVARYPCEIHDGVQQYKEKEIALQTLKAKDPNQQEEEHQPATMDVAPATQSPVATSTMVQAENTTAMASPELQAEGGGTEENASAEPDEGTPRNSTTTNSTSTSEGASTATARSASSTSTASTRVPVTESNGRQWFEGNTEVEVNGKPATKFWKLVDQYGTGFEYTPGCDRAKKKLQAIDYFMAVFPKEQLFEMTERTSQVLQRENLQGTSTGEVLKFLGILLIITRFEFGTRASLWSTTARNRFMPPTNLGHTTGMPRERFDHLWRYMVWSEQPWPRPENMSHEEWRWCLVQDFVDNYNHHRETYYQASSLICADESMSRWYGLGGNWINMGLPHYVAMDRKPEDGCEIQNACDGISGIMMRLKLVKSQAAEAAMNEVQRANVASADST